MTCGFLDQEVSFSGHGVFAFCRQIAPPIGFGYWCLSLGRSQRRYVKMRINEPMAASDAHMPQQSHFHLMSFPF